MRKNDSFETIAEKLMNADRICLFPHENPDGDAVGSTAALCSMLRSMGKECVVLIDEELPDNLKFMAEDYFVIPERDMEAPDISVAVDCGEPKRFPKIAEIFESGALTIAIDHHGNYDPYCQINYIDGEAAACGELIYELMEFMGHRPTKTEAEDLFAAITTDTGNFQYSNTTKTTHSIVCRLYDSGMDISRVSSAIYENESPQKMKLIGLALSGIRFFEDGKIAVGTITRKMLEEAGAVMSDAEPVVATIRSIEGVEIAIVLKERGDGRIFASMRSKTYSNVQSVAEKFGGGGHPKAAGCTLQTDMEDAMSRVVKEAAEAL